MTSFWTKAQLGTLIVEGPSNGYSPPSEKGAEGTLTLKLSATTTGRFIANDATTKRIHEVIPPDSRFWLRPGDVLIQRSNTLEYVGTAALFEGPERTFIYPDLMMRVRPGPALDARYLVEFLNAPATRKRVRAKATGTAGNMPKINGDVVRSIEVEVPPLNEQRRIVAKLEALQDRSRRAREALDAVPPLLEKLRQSILAAAFRGDLTKDWRAKNPDVEPADKLLARIRTERRLKWEAAELAKLKAKGKPPTDDKWKAKYSEPAPVNDTGLPALPAGWCWASMEEVTSALRTACYGVVQPGDDLDDGVPLVRVCDLDGDGETVTVDRLRRIPLSIAEEYERSRLEGGELLVSVVGTIGRTAIAPSSLRGANIARAVARLVLEDPVPVEWAMYWFNTAFMWHHLNLESREVARKTLNVGQLIEVPVPVAPPGEMKLVCTQVRAARARIAELGRLVMTGQLRADSLDRALLAKAFRGELVPQDPADEPAEAMLARLRGDGAPSSDSPAVSTKRARVSKRKAG